MVEPDAEGSVELASFTSRLNATIVDLLLQGCAAYLALVVLEPAHRSTYVTWVNHGGKATFGLTLAAVVVLYQGVCVALWSKTLGNRLAGTEVLRSSDLGRPSLLQSLTRVVTGSALGALSGISALFGVYVIVDALASVVDPSGQTLHDRAARTITARC